MAITISCTSAALDLNGTWCAGNLPAISVATSGAGVVGTSYDYFSGIKEFARGSFTPDKNSFRMIWMPANPEDRDLEPVTEQIESDNTVLYVAISTNQVQQLLVNLTSNVEYIPIRTAQQLVETKAVVADPSAYAKALNTCAQQAAMSFTSITDPKEAVKPSNVSKMVSAVAGIAGKAMSGNLLGAAKDAFANGGDIIGGLKDGFNFISSAVGSWFGKTARTDAILHQLVALGTLSDKDKTKVASELKELAEAGEIPIELASSIKQILDLQLEPVHQYGRRIPKFVGLRWQREGKLFYGASANLSDRYRMVEQEREEYAVLSPAPVGRPAPASGRR